ncbi:protein qua-1 isoform X2 [Clinocottus analis]|uniref:protein qua-1 isoform X2 n=1 Tax=Clinocottus analis TaxID=304258 RepID=UPI0035C06A33
MQQKLCSRGSGSFLSERNSQPCGTSTSCDLPFRCPRCGEQERFRSLASLRAHLEYRHAYLSPDVTPGGFSITGKLPDPLTAAIPWHDMSLPTRRGQQSAWRPPHVRSLSDSRDSGYPHSYRSARRRTQSVGVGTQAEEDEDEEDDDDDDDEEFGSGDEDDDDDDEEGAERGGGRNEEEIKMLLKKSDTCHHHHLNHHHHPFPPSAPLGPAPRPELDLDLDLELVELLLRLGDGGGLGGGAPAPGPDPAGGRQHHAAPAGQGEHGAGPDGHGAAVRARPLAAPGPGAAGGGGQGEVAEPAGGRGRHGDRRAEGAAQRLRERAGAPGEGGDYHPEVSGSGGSTGDVRESSNPTLHRESAETHRPRREAGGVLPGQRQPATVQPLQVPAAN